MPLLMCPNCNASMQELTRSNVTFDMCPACRGVWLDRGELEKIIEGTRVSSAPAAPAPPQQAASQNQPPQQRSQYRDHDDDDDRRRYAQQHGQHQSQHKKKRGFDIFDIFD
jgi:Zn-finger nucleic acid-binding protein